MVTVRKVSWDLDDEDNIEELSGDFYAGDVPPSGPYNVKVVGLRMKPDKNKDQRLNFWLEIDEKGAKAEFNGYRFYDGQSVNKQRQSFLLQVCKSLGVTWDDFRTKTSIDPNSDSNGAKEVVRFAGVKIADGKLVGRVNCKKGPDNNGDDRLEVARWLVKSVSVDELDDEADGEDDGDAPF